MKFIKLTLIVLLTLLSGAVGQITPTRAAGSVTLSDCPFSVGQGTVKYTVSAQCGKIDVPEDRATPASNSGRQLAIHFVVLPPLKANATGLPIFHLEGGPGGSAISNFGESWFGAYRTLRQDHPVVLIDQRGIGQSASLQCTEITDQAIPDLAKDTDRATDTQTAMDRLKACLTRLSKNADPQFYTSNALADDTDAVRAALGYDQIDVFGNSYGTSLGQIYLKRHGEHVAALVLDSIAAPWNFWTLDAAHNGQAALDKIFALCQADPACNKTYPDLPGHLQKALDRLDKTPVTFGANSLITFKSYLVRMTGDRLRDGLFQLMYSSGNASLIPQAVTQAANSDYTTIAGLLASLAELSGEEVSLGLYYSIVCSELVPFYTDGLIAQYTGDLAKNTFASSVDPRGEQAVCKNWRGGELNAADVAPVVSDRPVLILSGGLDPITPVKFGQEAHARLSHSTLVTLPYQAHGVIIASKCAQNLVVAFLAAPAQPLDTACAAKDRPWLFAGTYSVPFVPYTGARFVGSAPDGWTAQADGALTFFASPDKLQFAALGIVKGQKVGAVKTAVLDQIAKRYGAIDVQQELTVSILFISITTVAHAQANQVNPDEAFTGALLLRPVGDDVYVFWQSAPTNWFQAASLAIAPTMLGTLRPR